jgi:hypothetical protein
MYIFQGKGASVNRKLAAVVRRTQSVHHGDRFRDFDFGCCGRFIAAGIDYVHINGVNPIMVTQSFGPKVNGQWPSSRPIWRKMPLRLIANDLCNPGSWRGIAIVYSVDSYPHPDHSAVGWPNQIRCCSNG